MYAAGDSARNKEKVRLPLLFYRFEKSFRKIALSRSRLRLLFCIREWGENQNVRLYQSELALFWIKHARKKRAMPLISRVRHQHVDKQTVKLASASLKKKKKQAMLSYNEPAASLSVDGGSMYFMTENTLAYPNYKNAWRNKTRTESPRLIAEPSEAPSCRRSPVEMRKCTWPRRHGGSARLPHIEHCPTHTCNSAVVMRRPKYHRACVFNLGEGTTTSSCIMLVQYQMAM